MTNALPTGWTHASFNEIADINPRHPLELPDSLAVSFAPMPALSEFSHQFQFLRDRLLGEVRKGFTHFADGDVLFAKITPCMENGKGAVAAGLLNGLGCGTTELHVLRPVPGINPYYLYYFLSQESFRLLAKANFTGSAGQARVPIRFIVESQIPLPPILEQRRIVAKLDQLLEKVATCQKRLAKLPILVKQFRQSVLSTACSGRLTEDWRKRTRTSNSVTKEQTSGSIPIQNEYPSEWQVTTLGAVAGLVTSGSRGWAKYYAEKGAVFIRAQNINSDVLNLDDTTYVQLPEGC
jgi:type I restriction enzyme S subunit